MMNELSLQNNINTIIILYRDDLQNIYEPITICGSLVLSTYALGTRGGEGERETVKSSSYPYLKYIFRTDNFTFSHFKSNSSFEKTMSFLGGEGALIKLGCCREKGTYISVISKEKT